jgi:hypothetical protein
MLQRIVVVLSMIVTFSLPVTAFAQEAANECTAYGCHPGVGNPIQELGGMIVSCGIIAAVLGGVARRIVG